MAAFGIATLYAAVFAAVAFLVVKINLLAHTRCDFQKKLEHLRIMVRVGPSVGLIGTLIPMSTGLAGRKHKGE